MDADFLKLKLHLQSELEEVFRLWFGDIALVLDPEVAPLLSATVGMRFLLDRGIKTVHLLDLDATEPGRLTIDTDCAHIMYFVRPHARSMAQMCTQVKGPNEREASIFVDPV
jgi:hypothetical protein